MEKMKMKTTSGTEINIQKIAKIFPHCVTEKRNYNGENKICIDFEKLQEELSDHLINEYDERYEFTWPGKKKSINDSNLQSYNTLRPCRNESIDFDNTKNLYIEGDNLEVLKILRETYLGKIKMIYIDPPYNTGSDLIYYDDFTIDSSEYKNISSQFDENGNRLVCNTESNGRFHTDWLNMIYPRLRVAKDLLTEDGVIFISINDKELANLKKICDEIFGESSFLYNLSVVNRLNGNDNSSGMMETEEHCLIYGKPKFMFGVLPVEDEEMADWNKDEIGYWKEGGNLKATGINAPRKARPNLFFPIYINEDTLEFTTDENIGKNWFKLLPITDGNEMSWYWSKESFDSKHNDVIIKKTANGYSIYKKQRPSLGDMPSKRGKTTFYDPKYSTSSSSREIKEIFNGKKVFDYSKSTKLISDFISLGYVQNDDIVLDFFSGSGTTGHAVMQMNANDNGCRRFIMVQIQEEVNNEKIASKEGFTNICEIAKERLRRVGRSLNRNKLLSLDFGTGDDKNSKLDIGFRVLKLASSNMKDSFYYPNEIIENKSLLDLTTDNIKEDRTNEDLLFQIMLEFGIDLSASIKMQEIDGKDVYFVNDKYLLACFDKCISETTISEIAKLMPYYFVICDRSQETDNVADNFEQLFKTFSPNTIIKVI